MKSRGLVGRSIAFMKHLGDVKRLRRRMRIVLLVGTAMVVLWSSPITAQIPGFTPVFEQTTASNPAANVAIEGDAAATSGVNIGVMGTTASTGGLGVRGFATATSGQNFGVVGRSDSTTGTGVFGNATAISGKNIGVFGQSLSTDGRGVVGHDFASSGINIGVEGISDSTNGLGTRGYATATSGVTFGVVGRSDSPTGRGVFGNASATSGQNFGVFGITASAGDAASGNSAFGVFGRATDTTSPSSSQLTIGVGGRSDSPGGVGVFGRAAAPSGQNWGVVGVTNSAGDPTTQSRAFGVVGRATAPSGFTAGVQGIVDGIGDLTTQTPAIGVRGFATATSGFTIGVRGQTLSTGDFNLFPSIGVDGQARAASGFTIGVRGRIADINGNPGGSPTGTGVWGQVTAPSCVTLTLLPSTLVGPGQTCVGVFGQSLATSGTTAGVVGTAQSNDGSAGVAGQTTGSCTPIPPATSCNAPTGVFGGSTATSGQTAGVVGQINSPQGAAIVGNANNTGGLAGLFNGGPVSISCNSTMNACLFVNNTAVAVPDLAEDMPVARPVSLGDVVVLTRGQGYGIAPATQAYDTLVAGVISTAPRVRFGIGQGKGAPVAMVGVVRAKATAVNGAIKFGDLLTTSPVPGRLMRCEAALRCIGAIVGKALEPLPKGEQSILVLLWRQ